ncbi:MAG: ribbon-helix-helix protein, CopG family [Clostridiaceae bacterium]|nr:ribbon-helix-helix protein, CopG family [Clostridiaceae bacterium]
MSEHKKILISIPEKLLSDVDSIVAKEKTNRSEFVREAMKFYIKEKRKIEIREMMKKGYQEMGKINLEICNECFEADDEQQLSYEQKLAECE